MPPSMKQFILASAVCALILSPVRAPAASLSGIVLYASDHIGIPNGNAHGNNPENHLSAQLWRTALGGLWHGLGVWQGLPPDSLGLLPLNPGNMLIEFPLADGENDFTLLGEAGSLTRTDDYSHFTVNLYFDSATDAPPGVSVVFPRFNPPYGGPTVPSRAQEWMLNLALQELDARPQAAYDDGTVRVTVAEASFLPPERFDPEANFDFMAPQQFAKNGQKDFIGVLKVMVEPSTGGGGGVPGGGPGIAPAPLGGGAGGAGPSAFGGAPGGINPGYPGGIPGAGAGTAQQPYAPGQQTQHVRPTAAVVPTPAADAQADTESTPGESPTGGPTPPVGTPTAAKTHGTTSPTGGSHTTPTPKQTSATSATVHATHGTPSKVTPTPAAAHSGTPHGTRTVSH